MIMAFVCSCSPCLLFFSLVIVIILMSADGETFDLSRWQDATGREAESVKSEILADFPSLTVHVVPDGAMVTMDYRHDRVRLWVDSSGGVARAPVCG